MENPDFFFCLKGKYKHDLKTGDSTFLGLSVLCGRRMKTAHVSERLCRWSVLTPVKGLEQNLRGVNVTKCWLEK